MKISCKIYFRKDKNGIELGDNDLLKIYINVAREKGKANRAIIEIIAKFFFVKKHAINIVSGFTTLNKVIEIRTEKTKEELFKLLS